MTENLIKYGNTEGTTLKNVYLNGDYSIDIFYSTMAKK